MQITYPTDSSGALGGHDGPHGQLLFTEGNTTHIFFFEIVSVGFLCSETTTHDTAL